MKGIVSIERDSRSPPSFFATLMERIKNDDMMRHSIIMVSFSVASSLFMYCYQLAMGILLAPKDYGILVALTSLISIVMVSGQTINVTVSRFVSRARVRGESEDINSIWLFFLKRVTLIGLVLFGLVAVTSPIVSRFLNLDSPYYILVLFSSIPLFFAFYANQGTINGLQSFIALGISIALESSMVLLIGTALVYSGLGLFGGLIAFPLSYIVSLGSSFYFLRKQRSKLEKPITMAGAGVYAGYALVTVLAYTWLTYIDAVLAKHYLTSFEAGNYSVMVVLGRIALYAPMGVAVAMFPKTSFIAESGGNHLRPFLRAFSITLIISGVIVLFYTIFSQSLVQLLFGAKYPLASQNLAKYSLAMANFGLSFVTLRYFLSINRIKIAYWIAAVATLQAIALSFFHAGITQLSNVVLALSFVNLISMYAFYFVSIRKS